MIIVTYGYSYASLVAHSNVITKLRNMLNYSIYRSNYLTELIITSISKKLEFSTRVGTIAHR